MVGLLQIARHSRIFYISYSMNLFLSTLSPSPYGIFFSDDGAEISEVYFERNDFFLDRLSKFPELKFVQKIFYVSGPESFTSLRNMSVFLNVFTEFSEHEISLYAIPSGRFFHMNTPYSQAHVLSVGRRESFLFSKKHSQSRMPEISYAKYKNPEVIALLKNLREQNPDLCVSGEFSEKFLELQQQQIPDLAFAFPLSPADFVQELLANAEEFLLQKKRAHIEYGALPNIG